MSGRVLTSSSSDVVCTICAMHLSRARLTGPQVANTAIRRSIRTTAAAWRPVVETTRSGQDSDSMPGGWGASSAHGSPAQSLWGSRSSPGWGTPSAQADSTTVADTGSGRQQQQSPKEQASQRTIQGQHREENDRVRQQQRPQRHSQSLPPTTARGQPKSRPASIKGQWRKMNPTDTESSTTQPFRIRFNRSQPQKDSEQSAPGARGGSSRPQWKHLKFNNQGPDMSSEGSAPSDLQQQRTARFDQARRGGPVTFEDSTNTEWDPDPSQKQKRSATQNKKDTMPDTAIKTESATATPWHRGAHGGRDRNAKDLASGQRKSRKPKNLLQNRHDEENFSERILDKLERRDRRQAEKKAKKASAPAIPIILPDFISIANLANALRVRAEEFSKKLHEMGFEDFSNDHIIGAEDAGLIAQEFGFEPTVAKEEVAVDDIAALPQPSAEEQELLLSRPPVITIMGHVDHGKTTLLDYLRQSSVAAGEHGGITQHIGAFRVSMSSGRQITFLDTPGHAAFLDMRARGANVTDIVILVVAADDSVKPQTVEAIKHAKAAGVPIIVAITKVDKDGADAERVKRDLTQHGITVEDMGGDVQAIPVSGKTGQGMDNLEEAALALADILDVRADTNGQAEGWVLESSMKRTGKMATILVRRGTLRQGDIIVAGETWAKVRSLRNEAGDVVTEATPGQPIVIDGWDEIPEAGAEVLQAPSVQRARNVAKYRQQIAETRRMAVDVAAANTQRVGLAQQRNLAKEQVELENTDPAQAAALKQAADAANPDQSTGFIQVPLVVRADVAGSVEALSAALLAIGSSEIRASIIRADVGQVSESDIELASTAHGAIVNFGGPIAPAIRREIELQGVNLIDGNIIYRVTDDVKAMLESRLPKRYTKKVVADAEILQVFEYTMKGKGKINVAGCKVKNGLVERNKHFKILRRGETIFDGTLTALKHIKKDVTEVRKGGECGMSFDGFTAFEPGDQIQCYDLHEEKRAL